MTYDKPMQAYPDYGCIKNLPHDKFLVTSGFELLQWSKINALGIASDFKEIYIVDAMTGTQTKKDVFVQIMMKCGFVPGDVLVVGDDPESEIKAGSLLGMPTFLYDPGNVYAQAHATYMGENLCDIIGLLNA